MTRALAICVFVAAAFVPRLASGAASSEAKCESAKNRAAGDYARCRQDAEAKLALNGDTEKYQTALARCEAAIDAQFAKAESAAAKKGASCPTTGDVAGIAGSVQTHADTLAAALAAGGALPTCGDGAVNAVFEQCDTADLGGATCATLGHVTGDLACDGSCQFDVTDCDSCESQGGIPTGSGGCWFVADVSILSCTAACAARNRVCNEEVTRSAGSEDPNSGETCRLLADELDPGPAPHVAQVAGDVCGPDFGAGCMIESGGVARIIFAPGTTCAADGNDDGGCPPLPGRRVCACK